MLVAVADGLHHLAVVPGIGGVGVGKHQHQVDLIIGDAGVDLLMAALLVAQKLGDGQTGVVCDQPAGGGSGEQLMLHQNALIGGAELNHQLFFLIMCQKRDIHKCPLLFDYRVGTGTGWP